MRRHATFNISTKELVADTIPFKPRNILHQVVAREPLFLPANQKEGGREPIITHSTDTFEFSFYYYPLMTVLKISL